MDTGDPDRGWKIHVSATILSAPEVLARAGPILREHAALFKIPASPQLLVSLNAGLGRYSQVGKFLTIYPRSTAEAVRLARDLHRATVGLPGPRIPFDARYRSGLVHYRYGAFAKGPGQPAGFVRDGHGRLYRDRLGPGRAVPPWMRDPFPRIGRSRRKPCGPLRRDYLILKTRMQRGKGGVYEAVDLSVSPGRQVIIKEGRRHGETDWDGSDGYARLQHEGRVLRLLRRAGLPVPAVWREFVQDGNRYLVLERLAGRPLIPSRRAQPARPGWRRAGTILREVGALLEAIHAAGWVWNDCKPTHIIGRRGHYGLMDFEDARRLEDRRAVCAGSPHYALAAGARKMRARESRPLADDYALGVIAFQFGTGEFPPAEERRRAQIYQSTGCPDFLRSRIEALLEG